MNYWVIFLLFVPLGVFICGRPLSAAYPDNLNIYRSLLIDFLGLGGFNSYNITWWFNKLILILYILSPIVYIFTKHYPIVSILLLFGMQRLGVLTGYGLALYLMPFVLGFVWAQNAEIIQNKLTKVPKWIGVLVAFVLLIITIYCRQINFVLKSLEWDIYLAVAITLFVILCKPYRMQSDKILGFLGKHSMNIYMIHTFVYAYFWHDEIYALGNPWVILLVVLAISLTFSILIEFIKDTICFNNLLDRLMIKLDNR